MIIMEFHKCLLMSGTLQWILSAYVHFLPKILSSYLWNIAVWQYVFVVFYMSFIHIFLFAISYIGPSRPTHSSLIVHGAHSNLIKWYESMITLRAWTWTTIISSYYSYREEASVLEHLRAEEFSWRPIMDEDHKRPDQVEPCEEDEEKEHFRKILNAFRYYR